MTPPGSPRASPRSATSWIGHRASGGSRGARRDRPSRRARVFCRDGATTSRFLPALAAAGHGEFHFDASAQMRRRPLGPLTRGAAQPRRRPRPRDRGRPPPAHHPRRRDQGRARHAGRRPVLPVPHRPAAPRPAHRRRARHHRHRPRLRTVRGDHHGDDGALRGRRRARRRHLPRALPALHRHRLPDRARRLDSELLPGRGRAHRPQHHHPGARVALPARRPAIRRRTLPNGCRRHHHPGVRHRHRPRERRPARHHRQHARHLRHHAHTCRDRPVRRAARSASKTSTTPGSRNATGSKHARRTSALSAFQSRWAATGSRSTRPGPVRRTSPATATIASRWPSASPACAPPASPWTTRDASRRPSPDSTPLSPRSGPPGNTTGSSQRGADPIGPAPGSAETPASAVHTGSLINLPCLT